MKKSLLVMCLILSTIANLSPRHLLAQSISTYAGNGVAASTGDGSSPLLASFNNPSGVYIDAGNNLYVIEYSGCKIRKITSSGIVSTFAGNGIPAFAGDGGPATAASFYYPIDMVADAAGNIYVSDNANQRIRKITPAGIISTYAGSGAYGFSGDGGPATAAALRDPSRMAIDGAGNIYFADANNHRIRMITPAGIISTVAGNGTAAFAGDGGPATAASLSTPLGVGFDGFGNMYIADAMNHRVRKVNTAGMISTYAGNGSSVASGDGGPATAAGIDYINGITVDGSCNVYFTDWNQHTVRKINVLGTISRVVGNGTPGFSGDGGAAVSAQLNGPNNLVFDHAYNLYIPEYHNNRIRRVANLGEDVGGCPLHVITSSFTFGDSLVCQDSCITVTSTTTGTIDSVKWKVTGSGNTISGAASSLSTICFHQPGAAVITLVAYSGTASDSISQTMHVQPAPYPVVNQAGHTFTVTSGPYAQYQWFTGSTAIPGATNATYTYTTTGASYYVVVDSGSCKGSSATITTVGVNELSQPGNSYWAHANGEHIDLHASASLLTPVTIYLLDATGREIQSATWQPGSNTTTVYCHGLANGLYIIKLNDSGLYTTLKICKGPR